MVSNKSFNKIFTLIGIFISRNIMSGRLPLVSSALRCWIIYSPPLNVGRVNFSRISDMASEKICLSSKSSSTTVNIFFKYSFFDKINRFDMALGNNIGFFKSEITLNVVVSVVERVSDMCSCTPSFATSQISVFDQSYLTSVEIEAPNFLKDSCSKFSVQNESLAPLVLFSLICTAIV